jgi:hypothetical protein
MTEAPKPYVCGYTPVANLYQTASAAVAWYDAIVKAQNVDGMREAIEALREAVVEVENASTNAKALQGITDSLGRVGSQDGDVDVIGDWTHHNGEPAGAGGGHWVDCWAWVEDEGDDEDADEDEDVETCSTCGEEIESCECSEEALSNT